MQGDVRARMTKPLTAVLVTAVWGMLACCSSRAGVSAQASAKIAHDSVLAKQVGADEHGMKRFVLVFLKKGPKRDQDSAEASRIQEAHLRNIRRLAKDGKLILAGPFLDDGDIGGIYVFDVQTVAEARALAESDPAVKAGRLQMEFHPWYGPAMLVKVIEANERVTRRKVVE